MSVDTTTVATVVPAIDEPTLPPIRREAGVMQEATIIADSRDFPQARTAEKAAVRIMAGREIGIGSIAAVDGIRIENGKIAVSAAIMESVIDRSSIYDWNLIERTTEACTIEWYRNGKSRGQIRYTIDDAKTAGLVNKPGDNWKKHPAAMLFAAAFRTGARAFCAGAFNGNAVYEYEELGIATDEDGRPIDRDEGGELCTREQRQQIAKLVEAVGDSMVGYMAKVGIKLLDELSQHEAAKEIKKLEKRLLKAGKPAATDPGLQEALPAPAPAADKSAEQLTPALQTMQETFDDSRRHSTPEQRDWILHCAEKLVPDEAECMDMLKFTLTKRNCTKISQLNYLQAAALIESLEKALMDQKAENGEKVAQKDPPFDPSPAKASG